MADALTAWTQTSLPPTPIVNATLIGQSYPWTKIQLPASALTQDCGEINIIFCQTLYQTTHKASFNNYHATYLVAIGTKDPFCLPQFFSNMIYSAIAVISV